MIELVGVHGADHTHVIDYGAEPGKEFADPLGTLAVLLVVKDRPHHLWRSLDECKALAFQVFLRAVLTVELGELGLVLKEFKL